MLQSIHDRVKGWFANVIMIVLAVAFGLWGIQYYLEKGGHSDDVAIVNGVKITAAELNTTYARLKDALYSKNHLDSLTDDQQTELKRVALQQLITTQALSDAARKQGLSISSAQIDDVILQIPAFQENGNFSPQLFQSVLGNMSYSQDQFLKDLERTLLVNQMQSGVVDSEFALPMEVIQAKQFSEQKRDIAFAIIPTSQFLSRAIVTQTDINNYYQQNRNDFTIPEKLQIEYLELSADQLAKNIKINEHEAKQYYTENSSAFSENGKLLGFDKVKNKIEKTLQRQKVQQLFSDESQKLSDLTYSNSDSLAQAANTLNLKIQSSDFFTREGTKSGISSFPQVVTTAFNEDVLKNRNNSNLVNVRDGDVVVLRVKSYQPSAVEPLQQVQNQIKKRLESQLAQALAKQNAATITAQSKLNWQYKNDITRTTKGIAPQILQAGFEVPVSGIQSVLLSDGNYAIVTVKKISTTQTSSENSSDYKIYLNQMENMYSQVDYQLLVNRIIDHSKIKIYAQ